MPRWSRKVLLALLVSVLAFVVLGEVGLRLWTPPDLDLFGDRTRGTPGERVNVIDPTLEVHPRHGILQLDEALGYRPVPGGPWYAEHGAKWNDYPLEKPAGKRRLLFLGDSVTDRGKIIEALREALGDEGYEYWNGGVTGYASQQELIYYRDWLGGIPGTDHVLLTFHLNDYETTPITFDNGEDVVAVYGRVGSRRANPWLIRKSMLYRWWFTRSLAGSEEERSREIEGEVHTALRDLTALVHERGADFTVLVLPWLLERDRWSPDQVAHHADVVETLDALGVRHFEFLDVLDRAVEEGVELCERPRDVQHPSLEFARRMVAKLVALGFEP
jgi:hypothetical protein